ncbi:unnamed protein product [Cercospora beticola]|nr:unnamed protein product [Cercospora beticola]
MDGLDALIEDALQSKSGKIVVPDGAELLFPASMGPSIYIVRETDQILKAGASVEMCEAEAMRFVARNTSIPVPEVIDAYTQDGNGYILMSRLPGERLGSLWKTFDSAQKTKVIDQLRMYMRELGSLHGDFYGSLWQGASKDIWFMHLPCKPGKVSYGPYSSRQQYNEGLVMALRNSRPCGVLTAEDEILIEKILGNTDERKIFSHGDLHLRNILVNPSTACITGFVDWEAAGFSVPGRDYFEARMRARNDTWKKALDEIFEPSERAHFEMMQTLDNALIRHTFI